MKKVFVSIFILLSALFLTTSASAHSGCCSWHGGVRADGCGCNDGTPLSDTCAPYYTCNAPQQNTAPANSTSTDTTTNTYTAPVYVAPTDTPTSIPTNTPIPTPTLTPTPTPKPVHKIVVKKHNKPNKPKPTPTPTPAKNWWQWIFGW